MLCRRARVLPVLSARFWTLKQLVRRLSWLLSSSGGQRAAVRRRRPQERRGSKRDLTHSGGKIIYWVGSRAEPKRSHLRSTGKAFWHLGLKRSDGTDGRPMICK